MESTEHGHTHVPSSNSVKEGRVFISPRSLPTHERPTALYKYRSPDRVDVLGKLLIAFTPPLLFNDIFECFFGIGPDPGYKQLKGIYETVTKTLVEQNHLGQKELARLLAERKANFKQWMKRERSSRTQGDRCEIVRRVISSTTYILTLADKSDRL